MRTRTSLLAITLCVAVVPSLAYGFGKSKKSDVETQDVTPRAGKLVIALAPVESVQIEMPDQTIHDFGSDFQASLTTQFTESGRYIVADPIGPMASAMATATTLGTPTFDWTGTYVPSATVSVQVDALNFQTGLRGEHSFYGFDDRMRTPFNDGTLAQKNEFPLKILLFDPNWFDRTFDVKGISPFDTASGLDLGDGFSLNVLFAWLTMKYAQYESNIKMTVHIQNDVTGLNEDRLVDVQGTGYFYDLAGAYMAYSGGIRIARKDAMDKALKSAIASSYDAIERAVADVPLLARIDSVLPDGTILLGGPDAGVAVGTMYEIQTKPGNVIQVTESVHEGSVARLIQGDPASAQAGMIVKEVTSLPPLPVVSNVLAKASSIFRSLASTQSAQEPLLQAAESIVIPPINLPQADLGDSAPQDNWLDALWKSITGTIFLPYRIYRYFNYDLSYKAAADDQAVNAGLAQSLSLDLSQLISFEDQRTSEVVEGSLPVQDWAKSAASSSWGKQIGLDRAPRLTPSKGSWGAQARLAGGRPVVAVIDSGVDYNHPVIHDSLWLNPNPTTDREGKQDRYGWDFVSNDSRAYDDEFHGTQVASAILAVAPHALIMPLKVFNPWGITTSAGFYAAFQYAVDHGANVIVCGWATRHYSRAIELGVAYAQSRGVLVVAAAGDRGDDLSQVAAYPAALSQHYANVLSVTGVDTSDQLVQVSAKFANFNADNVQIAAPGQKIKVAEPRRGQTTETSTGLAAAIVAGAAVRQWTDLQSKGVDPDYDRVIAAIRSQSQQVPGLTQYVHGGLRLHL